MSGLKLQTPIVEVQVLLGCLVKPSGLHTLVRYMPTGLLALLAATLSRSTCVSRRCKLASVLKYLAHLRRGRQLLQQPCCHVACWAGW
jgi:hypothetical protein